jgi:hypothetical protein
MACYRFGVGIAQTYLSPGRVAMPALNTIAPPLETTLPGHIRRRVWSHPELSSHSLVVLTFDHLYTTTLTGSPRPEIVAAIESGADLDEVLGSLTTVIDLAAIRQLSLDLLTNSLNIEYSAHGNAKSRLSLTFSNPEAADACFTKIWRRLGNGFQLAPYKQDSWQSIRGPLGLLAAVLIITALLSGLLSVYQDMASPRHAQGTPYTETAVVQEFAKSRWLSLSSILNWKVICGLGGVGAACAQVWMYRRLTTPPVSLDLIRT